MQGELGTASPKLDEQTRSFVRRTLNAGLADLEDLKKVVVSLMAESDQFTPQRLADGLVGANILTQWQAKKLLSGKSKGFYLGSYRLLRPLGKGGMGVVYLGEHHVMKRLMALKILPPEATKDQRRIDRFKEEARACAQLDHPNIVRAVDFSEASGKLYIVMEYVDGIDLQYAVQRDGVMSYANAVDVLTQATQGLAHAHQRGIIHRDIKPSNLLLRTDGVVKVSDLGLARIGWTDEESPEKRRLTGTADYVAPEQAINSKTVDARGDIYSLGCTLFFLLVGRSPFDGDTVAKRLAKHQTAAIPDIRTFRKDCPPAIAELALRMMAKRPDDRPKSAVELLAQLKRLGGSSPDAGPKLRNVAPAGDTVVDDDIYQATIDDTSLSSDGEVQTAGLAADEFDFGSLPAAGAAVPAAAVAGATAAGQQQPRLQAPAMPRATAAARPPGPARGGRKRAERESSSNQQLLLGVGLAVAVVALLVVLVMVVVSFTKPLPEGPTKIKTMEDESGNIIIFDGG